MNFDMELIKLSKWAFRNSWSENHYLTYDQDREEIMEVVDIDKHVWYWTTPDEFEQACNDIWACDWQYSSIERDI